MANVTFNWSHADTAGIDGFKLRAFNPVSGEQISSYDVSNLTLSTSSANLGIGPNADYRITVQAFIDDNGVQVLSDPSASIILKTGSQIGV